MISSVIYLEFCHQTKKTCEIRRWLIHKSYGYKSPTLLKFVQYVFHNLPVWEPTHRRNGCGEKPIRPLVHHTQHLVLHSHTSYPTETASILPLHSITLLVLLDWRIFVMSLIWTHPTLEVKGIRGGQSWGGGGVAKLWYKLIAARIALCIQLIRRHRQNYQC